MMKILPSLALALLAAMIGAAIEPVANAAEPNRALPAKPRIGRIFFSPAERHSGHSNEPEATEESAAAPAMVGSGNVSSERLLVNGALSSEQHGKAVWVNGKVVGNTVPHKSVRTDRNGNIWVLNQDHTTRLILPGQSINRFGLVEDLVPPGAVTRH